jgi:hypothetical protein
MALISGPTVDTAITDPASDLSRLAASEIDDGRLIDELFLRFLSRPATEQEIAAGLEELRAIAGRAPGAGQTTGRLRTPTGSADCRAGSRASGSDRSGDGRITQLRGPDRAARSRTGAAATGEYRSSRGGVEGVRTDTAAADGRVGATGQTTGGLDGAGPDRITVQQQRDNSNGRRICLSSSAVPTARRKPPFAARTDLVGITGIKLELLTDPRLPNQGPGRAQNGNFVSSANSVPWAPEAQPDQQTAVVLQNAQADYSQPTTTSRPRSTAKVEPTNNGWASSPKTGENRTAVFETREDVGDGSRQTDAWSWISSIQDGQHTIGRFRISVTTAPRPDQPGRLAARTSSNILALAGDQRSDQQQAELTAFYRGLDNELKAREQALAEPGNRGRSIPNWSSCASGWPKSANRCRSIRSWPSCGRRSS